MEQKNLDNLANIISNDNKIIEILLQRIELLNKIIMQKDFLNNENIPLPSLEAESNDEKYLTQIAALEKDKSELQKDKSELQNTLDNKTKEMAAEITELNGKISILESDKKNLETEKSHLQTELTGRKEEIDGLEEKLNEHKTKLDDLQKYESVHCVQDLYEKYKQLPKNIRSDFDGLVFDDTPISFILSLADDNKLKRFYEKIEDLVANSDIESSMEFTEDLKVLADIFNFFYENYLVKASNIKCERQNIFVDSDFDETMCYRVGKRQGKVKDVLIQGYSIDGESVHKSIVLVEDY